MSLPTQLGFWEEKVIADCRSKLAELCNKNPQLATSEKRCLLEFYATYHGLAKLLDEKWLPFAQWFMSVPAPSTIDRCLRFLKESGVIPVSPEKQKQREKREQAHRNYWAREAKK